MFRVTKRYAVALLGQDRPGIVASLTQVLLDLGCNVEDVSTSILRGHFAIMLIAAGSESLDLDQVRVALDRLDQDSGFTTAVWEVTGDLTSNAATHVLTVYGPDQAGIVHAVAAVAGKMGANISDMTCRLHDQPEPTYVLTAELQLPDEVSEDQFAAAITPAVEALGFRSSLRSVEAAEF